MTAIKQDGPYDSRTLTKVFCLSSVALAVTTAWMVLDDHSRQWRGYQEEFRELELARAKADEADAERAQAAAIKAAQDAVAKAEADVAQKRADIDKAEDEVKKAQARKEKADLDYADAKSYVDSYVFFFEHSGFMHEEGEHVHYHELLAKANKRLADSGREKELATQAVKDAREVVAKLEDPLLKAKKQLDDAEGKVKQAKKKVQTIDHSFKNDWFRNRPGVDFLDPTEKPRQIVLKNLKDDYYFADVTKVDRCQSCHLGVDRRGFEGSIVHVEGKGLVAVASIGKTDAQGQCEVTLPTGQVETVKASELKDELKVKKVFQSHPNLDLYLSASSPHPVDRFGCTVCHMGEGQSVSFMTATHSPNDEAEREHWESDGQLKWEEREHWSWPQFPKRYIQASCLLCHANNRPVPGADKLNFGRETFERLSCVGCHKMKGYEDEPKRGPDLRHLDQKLKKEWVAYWVEDPARFRPKTNMPRFFNTPTDPKNPSPLLAPTGDEKNASKEPTNPSKPEDAARTPYDYDVREQLEIKAITRYLFNNVDARDQRFQMPEKLEGGNAERGEILFTARGCVGCHRIEPTADEAEAARTYAPDEFGPNLYNSAHKTTPEWIYAWISNPKHYWAETRMPNLRLEKDDAKDLATFLVTGTAKRKVKDDVLVDAKPTGWVDKGTEGLPGGAKQLEYAVVDYLKKDFTQAQIDAKLKAEYATEDARFLFLGEQTIGRLGCFGCHFIKGMESRPGIGRELSDIGDKNLTQVDWGFESISRFMSAKEKAERGSDKIRENRHEWLTLKVKHPRIFDRGKVKEPLDRSRMPQFRTTAFERESLVTYLLGHTANRKVPDEYKYRPAARRANVIEGEYALLRNNCKACHLVGVDRLAIKNGAGKVISQPLVDSLGRPVVSPISIDEATKQPKGLETKTWFEGHLVLDILDQNPEKGVAALQLYVPSGGKPTAEWITVQKGKDFAAIDERQAQLVGADADLLKVVELTPPSVWGAEEKTREQEKQKQLAAIRKGLAWRNRGGTSLDKIVEERVSETIKDYNPWTPEGAKKFDPDDYKNDFFEDAKAMGPPHLIGEGRKVQPLWLQSFLKDPVEIRPALRPSPEWQSRSASTYAAAGGARMPTYGFSDAGTQVFSRYFAATDEEERLAKALPILKQIQDKVKAKEPGFQKRLEIQNQVYPKLDDMQLREYFNVTIVDGVFNFAPRAEVSLSRALDEKTDGYVAAQEARSPGWYSSAFRMFADTNMNCAGCHYVQGRQPKNNLTAFAPDLGRVRERLRPAYLREWLAEPKFLIPGTKMPTVPFASAKASEVQGWSVDQRIGALVDWLMAGAPTVLEVSPKELKPGTEVLVSSDTMDLNAAGLKVEVLDGGNWKALADGKDFTRELSGTQTNTPRVTALRVRIASEAGKAYQVRVSDGRSTAVTEVTVGR